MREHNKVCKDNSYERAKVNERLHGRVLKKLNNKIEYYGCHDAQWSSQLTCME